MASPASHAARQGSQFKMTRKDVNIKEKNYTESMALPVYSTDPPIHEGGLYWNSNTQTLYVSTDTKWEPVENANVNCLCVANILGSTFITVTSTIINDLVYFTINANTSTIISDLTTSGNGESIVADGVGPDIVLRSILGGNGIVVSTVGNNIVISPNTEILDACFITECDTGFPGTFVLTDSTSTTVVSNIIDHTIRLDADLSSIITNLTSSGNGQSLVVSGVGPDLVIRSILGNNLVDVSTDANTIIISANNSLINTCFVTVCDIETIFPNSFVLVDGSNTVVVANSTDHTVRIDANVTPGTANLVSSGNGQSLVVDGVGPDLVIRSILGNNLVDVVTDSNTIIISANNNLINACFITVCDSSTIFPNSFVLVSGANTVVVSNSIDHTVKVDVALNSTNLVSSGNGQSLVVSGTGPDLVIRSILGEGVSVTTDSNTIIIDLNINLDQCFVTQCNADAVFPNTFILANGVYTTVNTTGSNIHVDLATNITVNNVTANNILTENITANTANIVEIFAVNANIDNLIVLNETDLLGNVTVNCNAFPTFEPGDPTVSWLTRPGGASTVVGGIGFNSFGNVITTGFLTTTSNVFNANGNSSPQIDSGKFLVGSGANQYALINKWNAEGNVVWATQISAGGLVTGYYLDIDSSDNIYTTGRFGETANLFNASGNSSVTSPIQAAKIGSGTNAYIAKHNTDGQAVWATTVASTNTQEGLGISVDASNVYATGSMTGTSNVYSANVNSQFDANIQLPGQGSNDVFIAKWNSSGQALWGTIIGSTGSDSTSKIFVESSSVYVTCSAAPNANLFNANGVTPVSSGISIPKVSGVNSMALVARYNKEGQAIWGTKVDSTSACSGLGIVASSTGIYGTGSFSATANVFSANGNDPIPVIPMPSLGGTSAYIAKWNNAGQAVWGTKIDSSGADQGIGIDVDSSGVYVTGSYANNANIFNANGTNFPTDTNIRLTGVGTTAGFIVKYDLDGQVIWAVNITATGSPAGKDIKANSFNVYGLHTFATAANVFLVTANSSTNIGRFVTAAAGGGVTKFIQESVVSGEGHGPLNPNIVVDICADTFIYGNLTVSGSFNYLESVYTSTTTLSGIEFDANLTAGSIAAPVTFDESIFVYLTSHANTFALPLIDSGIPF